MNRKIKGICGQNILCRLDVLAVNDIRGTEIRRFLCNLASNGTLTSILIDSMIKQYTLKLKGGVFIKRVIKRLLFICFVLILMPICFFQPARANEQRQKTVRVGFPIQAGISYIDEQGNYAGYMVDYLDHVQLYTNWEIEYVQVEGDFNTQLSTLLQMLERGEIDLLGTMNYSRTLGDKFLYPNYAYGTIYTVLAADEDNNTLMFNDFSNWDTLRVASYPGYQKEMRVLEKFAQSCGLQYEILEFETVKETINAVKTGVADATLQVDITLEDGLRTIARVSPTPYYFALNTEKNTLLQELNLALEQMKSSFPLLEERLYDRYFSVENAFYVSKEDREFVKNLGILNVLFIEGNPPFQYESGGKMKGCALDYLDEFAEKTGLKYEIVVAGNLVEAEELMENDEIDLIACIPISSELTTLAGIEFTNPYLSSRMVQICSASVQNFQQISEDGFRSNAGLALMEVKENTTYAPWIDFYSLDYYRKNDDWFQGVAVDWSNAKNSSYAVGITQDIPDELRVLLNNYANSLDENERQELLYRYTSDTYRYTFGQFVYKYRYAIGGTGTIVLLVCAVFFFWKNERKSQQIAIKKANELNYISSYDMLTGAYNEKKFYELLEEDCKNKIPRALVTLNIRDFKYINEKFSFEVANKFLSRICTKLNEFMRDGEYFCRQSADVFYIALSVDMIEKIRIRTHQIHEAIRQISRELLAGYPISVYGSFVFTDTSPEPFDVPANMGFVLAALAYAKRKNTDDIYYYGEEFHKQEQNRHYVEVHMNSALENGEFKLYLQPKKNLVTGKFDQAEALVRWETADGRIISPNDFIPVFEENGFCKQLDLYMVERVCRQLRQWMDDGLSGVGISVNQTKLLFIEPDYVDILCGITQKYGIPNHLITLELLEGLFIEDQIEQLNEQIIRLREAGFRVSMDDFGSGYSSLNVLGDLDIDEVKVDRAFLMSNSRTTNYSRRQILMEEIIRLAKKIGVNTVAEGVESAEDEAFILQFGYNYGQGYLYSKPIPAEKFEEKYLSGKNLQQQI